jgi:hypothetical protein
LRAAFLSKCELSAQAFIGTSVSIAVVIDVVRLLVYSPWRFLDTTTHSFLILWGIAGALCGTLIGKHLLEKNQIHPHPDCDIFNHHRHPPHQQRTVILSPLSRSARLDALLTVAPSLLGFNLL